MEVHFKPETESRLTELASRTGRATDDLVEDALSGYLAEIAEVREMLDGRYDDVKSGRVKPIDGEAFFDNLRQREDELVTAPSEMMADQGIELHPGARACCASRSPQSSGDGRDSSWKDVIRKFPSHARGIHA